MPDEEQEEIETNILCKEAVLSLTGRWVVVMFGRGQVEKGGKAVVCEIPDEEQEEEIDISMQYI